MVSGRGLDFTGGTLDKLESIPGYRTKLSVEEMKHCIATCNYFIAGSTETLCPGDRTLYRIRDITATVDCAPLIIASILGKKYAEGAKYLVLDLKVGSSAICKRTRDAEQLASKMLTVAEHLGMKLKVVLTKMETPIGKAVGNSLEVAESVQILKGGGPPSVKSLITRLGGELLFLTGKARSHVDGMRQVQAVLDNGKALEYFEKCLVCQGVDPETVKKLTEDEPWEVIKRSDHYLAFKAPRTGESQSANTNCPH
ncbi:hypothetical protein AAG570_007640 [Ranatra chinensis]|uniref:Glycosyl transferase family 3 domain-containing protein n=1 Tax=Ranatra chinensis TaxID=642074 RepID=A0ABD0XU52_9HEMI